MRGATILKAADDKTRSLNKHTLMAYSGEAGDTGMPFQEEFDLPWVFTDFLFVQCNSQSTSKQTPSSTRCATKPTCPLQHLRTLFAVNWQTACDRESPTMSTSSLEVSTQLHRSLACTGWTILHHWPAFPMPHMVTHSTSRTQRAGN